MDLSRGGWSASAHCFGTMFGSQVQWMNVAEVYRSPQTHPLTLSLSLNSVRYPQSPLTKNPFQTSLFIMVTSVVSSVNDSFDGLTIAPEADVVIIGAGLAGLCAARSLHEAGKRVVVLEARGRVSIPRHVFLMKLTSNRLVVRLLL